MLHVAHPMGRLRAFGEGKPQGCGGGRKSVRVRSDGFSTRYKISSNRPNAGLWMVLQGRSEAGSQSVAVITPLTRRCRARVRHPNGPARPRTATQDLLALNI